MNQRRFLPPVPWLAAFEAVERLGSVTRAARELDLTQSAVSRQVLKLEQQLGVALFARQNKRLIATPAGRAYARDIRTALRRITDATLRASTNPAGGTLELAILPAFGTHWLAPRLPDFLARHPGVTLNLATRTRPFDFTTEPFHAAIHFGRDNWPGTQALKLMDEALLPVFAPSLCAAGAGATPAEIARLPLLHLTSRRRAWARWFAACGITAAPAAGVVFDQFATMQQAALAGLGAAMLPEWLVHNDLEQGRLITPAGAPAARIGAYFLVWPDFAADHPPLGAFREWISGGLRPEV